MPGKDKGLVGIELSSFELRAVYVRIRGGRPEVAAAAHVPMPKDCLQNGIIQQPAYVAIALGKLFDEMKLPNSVPAILGVPSQGITIRTLSIPHVPDEELATIVAGEVEHYRILRTKGSHAFVPLAPPVKPTKAAPISVVVAAAEEQVTQSMGETASQAGVTLAALEPVEFGQLRAAASAAGPEETAFTVLVGDSATDLAAFANGQLWFYRRVEYGSRHLTSMANEAAAAASPFSDHGIPTRGDEVRKYLEPIVDSLCAEISRSIDYLSREYREHAVFSKLMVCVGNAALADIDTPFSERLSLPIEIVQACTGFPVAPSIAPRFQGPEGLRYGAAFGLAIRDHMTFSAGLPRIDLYAEDRYRSKTQTIRRNITGSLVTSAVALAVALVAWLMFSRQINSTNAQADAAKARTTALMSQATLVSNEHQARARQIGLLTKDAMPATELLDFVAVNLDPSVGLQSLTDAPDGTITLNAQAIDTAGMLRTVESFQRIPIIHNVLVQSFASKNGSDQGINFVVTAKALPLSSILVTNVPDVTIKTPPPPIATAPSKGAGA